jgi:hypothetical protein
VAKEVGLFSIYFLAMIKFKIIVRNYIILIFVISFLIQCYGDKVEDITIYCDPPLEEDKFYILGSYDSLPIITDRTESKYVDDDCVNILLCGGGITQD